MYFLESLPLKRKHIKKSKYKKLCRSSKSQVRCVSNEDKPTRDNGEKSGGHCQVLENDVDNDRYNNWKIGVCITLCEL